MASGPIPFIDGHNDVLLALHLNGDGAGAFLAGRSDGHLDLARARQGGFAAGFFAVFVLPETDDDRAATRLPDRKPPYSQPLAAAVPTAYAAREAGELIDLLDELSSSGEVRVARSAKEVEAALNGGPLAAILHFEGAEPIEPGLENLEGFYERGLRSLGPVWSRPNAFAEGVPFRFPSTPDIGGGLTEAGSRLVAECNRLGILIDLAHLNERGFWDVAQLSAAPLVASHSNARAVSELSQPDRPATRRDRLLGRHRRDHVSRRDAHRSGRCGPEHPARPGDRPRRSRRQPDRNRSRGLRIGLRRRHCAGRAWRRRGPAARCRSAM